MQGIIFTRNAPIYIRTRAKSTTDGRGAEPKSGRVLKKITRTQIFFTLKISYLRKNFNKINPYILKLNKLVISLQCKGWTTTSHRYSRGL